MRVRAYIYVVYITSFFTYEVLIDSTLNGVAIFNHSYLDIFMVLSDNTFI